MDDGIFCTNCGAPISSDSKFCNKCGSSIAQIKTDQSASSAPELTSGPFGSRRIDCVHCNFSGMAPFLTERPWYSTYFGVFLICFPAGMLLYLLGTSTLVLLVFGSFIGLILTYRGDRERKVMCPVCKATA